MASSDSQAWNTHTHTHVERDLTGYKSLFLQHLWTLRAGKQQTQCIDHEWNQTVSNYFHFSTVNSLLQKFTFPKLASLWVGEVGGRVLTWVLMASCSARYQSLMRLSFSDWISSSVPWRVFTCNQQRCNMKFSVYEVCQWLKIKSILLLKAEECFIYRNRVIIRYIVQMNFSALNPVKHKQFVNFIRISPVFSEASESPQEPEALAGSLNNSQRLHQWTVLIRWF